MKRIRCFAAVFCLLLLLAGCAGEPKVKQTFEGDLASYAEMTDGTWACDGRSYAYRLEIRGRLQQRGQRFRVRLPEQRAGDLL